MRHPVVVEADVMIEAISLLGDCAYFGTNKRSARALAIALNLQKRLDLARETSLWGKAEQRDRAARRAETVLKLMAEDILANQATTGGSP